MIRSAVKSDSDRLTRLSFSSKRYWNYPEQYFDTWETELTISKEYIDSNHVFICEEDGKCIGYYSIARLPGDIYAGDNDFTIEKGDWLEHLFIDPDHIGKGYGTKLMKHMLGFCGKMPIKTIKIMADPHSKGFYAGMGADYKHECPSSIPGRTVSYFEWEMG